MKRRLSDEHADGSDGADPESLRELIASHVAKELTSLLGSANSSRFGRVAFAHDEQTNVNEFLHQKLGKENLTRRPGPGGKKLTYIESCKAIELANKAFGFNGWSCKIVECKEEYVSFLHSWCDLRNSTK